MGPWQTRCGGGYAMLHNMSAPPRTSLRIEPLLPRDNEGGDAVSRNAAAGLEPLVAVNIDKLLAFYIHGYKHNSRDIGPRSASMRKADAKTRTRRLAGLVVLARLACRALDKAIAQHVDELAYDGADELVDEFTARCNAMDTGALGLPAFAFRGFDKDLNAPLEMDLVRALAIVSRTTKYAGQLFIASRSAVSPVDLLEPCSAQVVLYVPAGTRR